MTNFNKPQSIPLIENKESALCLSKASWEIQNQRIILSEISNQTDSIIYFQDLILQLESQIDVSLNSFCSSNMVTKWAISNVGIGPVIATRLMSYIDINKSRTPEHLWSYAGLIPQQLNKQKNTYNNNLKEVCMQIGKNFVKYSSKDKCFYGQLYIEDRQRRIDLNENNEYSDLAQETLLNFNLKDKNLLKDKPVYESGKLPQQRIDAQAQRYAVKIFLAHWHAVAYYESFKVEYESHHKNIIPVYNSPY